MANRSSDAAMMQSNYDNRQQIDELLAAVDRLESKHDLSLMATAAMQSAMRAQSDKIAEMRSKIIELETTVSELAHASTALSAILREHWVLMMASIRFVLLSFGLVGGWFPLQT